jgi:hypothetical protein
MYKEQEELVGEAYENYLNKWDFEKYPNDGSVYNVDPIKVKEHTKPQFEYRCKTDTEFSEKWGLKIEEHELSLEDRIQFYYKRDCSNGKSIPDKILKEELKSERTVKMLDKLNIPTRLITLTYNNETIESYERK